MSVDLMLASTDMETVLALGLDENNEAWLRVGDRSRRLTWRELDELASVANEIATRMILGG